MKGNVLIQIKWADPERSGLRTLVLGQTTVDATFRRLSEILTRNGARHIPKTPPPDDGPATRIRSGTACAAAAPATQGRVVAASGRNGQGAVDCAEADVPSPRDNATHGEVRWINEVPAGRFGDPNTLIQIAVDDRGLLVKIVGRAALAVGAPVTLHGVPSTGTFFEGEVRDTATGAALIIVAPTPLL